MPVFIAGIELISDECEIEWYLANSMWTTAVPFNTNYYTHTVEV